MALYNIGGFLSGLSAVFISSAGYLTYKNWKNEKVFDLAISSISDYYLLSEKMTKNMNDLLELMDPNKHGVNTLNFNAYKDVIHSCNFELGRMILSAKIIIKSAKSNKEINTLAFRQLDEAYDLVKKTLYSSQTQLSHGSVVFDRPGVERKVINFNKILDTCNGEVAKIVINLTK